MYTYQFVARGFLKRVFFKSCFKRSAEGTNTTVTILSFNWFVTAAFLLLQVAIDTAIFKGRPFLRFPDPNNICYRTYVSNMHHRSNKLDRFGKLNRKDY